VPVACPPPGGAAIPAVAVVCFGTAPSARLPSDGLRRRALLGGGRPLGLTAPRTVTAAGPAAPDRRHCPPPICPRPSMAAGPGPTPGRTGRRARPVRGSRVITTNGQYPKRSVLRHCGEPAWRFGGVCV